MNRTAPRLRTATDALDLIERHALAVSLDPTLGSAEKARIVGQLASAALKAIEITTLEDRLAALEAQAAERQRQQ